MDEEKKKNFPIQGGVNTNMKQKGQKSVFEELQFPEDGMTYGH